MRLQSGRPLFNFGSLRDLRVLSAVVGRRVSSAELRPAKLRGWRPVKLRNALYPALIRSAGSTTDGVLFLKPSSTDVRRIEHYENGLYSIRMLPVTIDGRRVTVQVYAENSGKIKSQLTGVVWDFKRFQQRVPSYLTDVYKWMRRLYESILDESVRSDGRSGSISRLDAIIAEKEAKVNSMFDDIISESDGDSLFDFVERDDATPTGLFDFVEDEAPDSLFDVYTKEEQTDNLDKRAKALALSEHLAQIKSRMSA